MKDVAREAGVAVGTVSKVFNNIPVGASYQARVEKAAKKLGYQVNLYARGLRASKTNIVALILPRINHPFFADLAQRICIALDKRDHRMLLFVTDSTPEREQLCIDTVRRSKVDGVIALIYAPKLQIDLDLPFVSIDRRFTSDIPCISSDNYSGGQLAAEKLLELGCHHLAYFRNGASYPGEVDKRGIGFEQFCRSQDVEFKVLCTRGEDLDDFRTFLQEHMMTGKLDIDGIFCSTDLLAMNVKEMLEDLGLRVPEDVQIIGFDGIHRFTNGQLYCSTIVQPVDKLAETCVELLLRTDQENTPALICLPVRYAAGGTTKGEGGMPRGERISEEEI